MSTTRADSGVHQQQGRVVGQARTRGVRRPSPPDILETRFRELLVCIRLMGRELTVAGRLRRMVELSVGLGNAQHAALALRAPDGSVERFVLSSGDTEQVAAIQLLLTLYGAAGSEQFAKPLPARRDRRSAPVLDVPLHTGFGLLGNLFVIGQTGGPGFSDEDRELLTHFAETTALGVDNAGHLEESRQRQHWLMASAEISRQLLDSASDERTVWREIAGNVKYLAHARTVTISLPDEDDPDELCVDVASGVGAAELEGRRYHRAGSLAEQAMETGEVQIVGAGLTHVVHAEVQPNIPVGQLLALPLKGRGEARGAIVVSRQCGEPPFTASDVRMAEDFAIQAGLALELAEARSAQQILETQEDRHRIAESLQDQVVQRLFSIGLSLQSTAARGTTDAARPRLLRAISDIDDTIQQVRSSIDPGRGAARSAAMALMRTTVVDLLAELEPAVGFAPTVQFSGTLDTVVDERACTNVGTVLREALVAMVGHARATSAQIEVCGRDDGVDLLVTDDGVGFGQRGEGLSRLWEHAADAGLTLTVERPPAGGLRLRWFLPRG